MNQQSATVIILPVVTRERVKFSIALSRRDWGRLCKRAAQWNMTPQQAAAELVALCLDPKRSIP